MQLVMRPSDRSQSGQYLMHPLLYDVYTRKGQSILCFSFGRKMDILRVRSKLPQLLYK